jgi:vancomycin resistance protein YoaR
MSSQTNEQVMLTPEAGSTTFWRRPAVWISAIVLLIVLIGSIVAYFAWNAWDQARLRRLEEQRIEQQLLEEESQRYEAARAEVLIDSVYEGVFVNGIDLSGKTLDQMSALLRQEESKLLNSISYSISLDDQIWDYDAASLGVTSNVDEVIKTVWETGRISGQMDEKSQIYDRQEQIHKLAENPLELQIELNSQWDVFAGEVEAVAESLGIEPVDAEVTGFDVASKRFLITEMADGRVVLADKVLNEIKNDFADGKLNGEYSYDVEPAPAQGDDLAAKLSGLGLVAQAKTLAPAPDAGRDNNLTLIVRALNGHVVLPGETFSFNGVIGRRTAAKGYMAAGAISDGALIKTIGGGICQPNTTLYQAVLKADLNVIERYPHSFPSTYTDVGLDAAIDWGSADMKFVNNTDYPIAIVCWYNKPDLVFQIYGRPLPEGVSISLKSEVTANEPPEGPIENLVPDMEPGTRVLKRAPHNMIKSRAYKIYTKNGEFLRSEEIRSSYYRPIRAIYEVGPPKPTPEPTPVPPDPTPAPTEAEPETAPEGSEETTAAA